MNVFTGLFLVLLTLKLCNIISVSWWVVTAPLWGGVLLLFTPVILATVVAAVVAVATGVLLLIKYIGGKR